jgi:dihydrofolate reductase
MRSVVAYELSSLDGVAEDPDAFIHNWDEEMQANMEAVIALQDTVLLGRRSYEEWARFWPTIEDHPFATFINPVQKYVATSSPLDPAWTHAAAVDGELAGFVRELKAGTGGDIGIHASISVVQALLAHGLVDELKLVVAPSIPGKGRRLLDGVPATQLEVTRSVMSATGHLLVDYRIVR